MFKLPNPGFLIRATQPELADLSGNRWATFYRGLNYNLLGIACYLVFLILAGFIAAYEVTIDQLENKRSPGDFFFEWTWWLKVGSIWLIGSFCYQFLIKILYSVVAFWLVTAIGKADAIENPENYGLDLGIYIFRLQNLLNGLLALYSLACLIGTWFYSMLVMRIVYGESWWEVMTRNAPEFLEDWL